MTIKLNSKGEEVKTLQKMLNSVLGSGLIPDGKAGPLTIEVITEYQRMKGLTADGICGNKTWSAICQDYKDIELADGCSEYISNSEIVHSRRKIDKIILHCTATGEGNEVSVKTIDKWHRQRGWNGIGYHYVIHLDGRIECGRHVDIAGAHTEGYNAHSIGIVYVGGVEKNNTSKPKDTRTPQQKEAMKYLVQKLMRMYYLNPQQVYGHNMFANKGCPSFDVKEFRKEL